MPALRKEDKLRLLGIILESRHADLREQNLNRQGKGHFHVSGMGHEALAAISIQMQPDDYIVPYYRDRGLVLGRGLTTRHLALEYFAKRETGSGGRMMPSHYSDRDLHIWSVPTPTGSQLLPACGMAWGMKLDSKQSLVVTTVGDAATRQGDFYEAVCFAKEKQLPVLFVVEDNAYGISTPTRRTNPLAIEALQPNDWQQLEGGDVGGMHAAAAEAIRKIRAGSGPAFFWVKMERLSSHTSSDDQKLYRTPEELAACEKADPLGCWKETLIAEGLLTTEEFARMDEEVKERVRAEYSAAERAADPSPNELFSNTIGPLPQLKGELLPPGKYRIGDSVNRTLRLGLKADPGRIIFGEDIQDPKGGVFRLTQKLSTEFPKQVFNSPLAESTILGVACGLAAYGKRPVFELQFIDFIYPGFNQLITNIANLRWRSFGQWKCPAVIYAPYGAYLPGGSLWHSQANESALAHYPGLIVVVPSTPEDAAGLLWTAMHCEDPVLFLIPKHMFWAERELTEPIGALPLGKANLVRQGNDVTLVAWGNTVEKSLEALARLDNASVELFDLRCISPWDKQAIQESVRKTGRLVVVQEDTENCSVGQMIISHIASQPELWNAMIAPPTLVSKGNVMIGYNPIYEYAALPDVERIVSAIQKCLSTKTQRKTVVAGIDRGAEVLRQRQPTAAAVGKQTQAAAAHIQKITVPIMGEGIRAAKIVSLLKHPGDAIHLDDDLCEVETDKAVYPIQSSFAGTMGEWKTNVGETVEIGQELGTIITAESAMEEERIQSAVTASPHPNGQTAEAASPLMPSSRPSAGIEPALSPTITRKLAQVIPANLQIDARWQAIHKARESAKRNDGKGAASPSAMIAWAVVRAMHKHAAFRRLIQDDETIVQNDRFDLGIAVALESDRLATAVITDAGSKNWADFVRAYHHAIDTTRQGQLGAMNAPVVITSLGAFGVRVGAPIVVPPSVATLFVGSAHPEIVDNGKKSESAEVVTLSLTFDHRVVNGAGAANFVHAIKEEMENFKIPKDADIRIVADNA